MGRSTGHHNPESTAEARLHSIIDSAMDAIVVVDGEQRIRIFNRAAEAMFRCVAGEALGRPIDQLIPVRFRAAHAEHMRRFAETGVTSRRMGRLPSMTALRADGREFPIEASISRAEADGETLCTVIIRDVSESEQAKALIRQLSLPVLQVRDHLLLAPVVGPVDAERGRLILDGLLDAAADARAKVVILDVTAMTDADALAAHLLMQLTDTLRLLGADLVVTGISTQVARELAQLHVDLSRLRTVSGLQAALEEAERLLSMRPGGKAAENPPAEPAGPGRPPR